MLREEREKYPFLHNSLTFQMLVHCRHADPPRSAGGGVLVMDPVRKPG